MPKKYERIRDNLKKKGMSDSKSKTVAAKIYNSGRKKGQRPVGRKTP